MNLKDLFDKAENGTLTYEQFESALKDGGIKLADLSEGNYVDKQKYTDDLAARDTRIASLDETIKAREGDLATLKEQLVNAGEDADKLGELNTKFADLQKQYDRDTKEYQKQLKEQAYKHAVNDFANSKKFTSQAAKRDFIATMMSKDFKMEGDTIIGATDFVDAYSKENADAFAVEKAPEDPKPQPHFVGPTSPNGGDNSSEANPFSFNFTGVRPHE